jgi:hypothetical protein
MASASSRIGAQVKDISWEWSWFSSYLSYNAMNYMYKRRTITPLMVYR